MRDNDNPSFSSTLLDKIYSSIDNGGTKNEDLKFYTQKKQQSQIRHEKANADKTKKQGFVVSEFVRKPHHEHEHEHELLHDLDYQDGVFFSSTSISSDSSSGCFSSSDTESMYGTTTKTKSSSSSCFVRPWPKPVKTRVSAAAQSDNKTLKTGDEKFHGDFQSMKQKQRQKQHPISPGGRVVSFINSLLGNTKKQKGSPSSSSSSSLSPSSILNRENPVSSSCSSASSFSRSCLSKNSPSTREKLRDNGVKRTVRFCPVSVIVDEESRPCGHKCLYKEEVRKSNFPSVSWRKGKSPSSKRDEEVKFRVVEKTKRVEEMAREFLKVCHQNHKKNDSISRDFGRNYEGEDEDDASSCSSSDLFELDHHVLRGLHKYEELPVYETTHVETNRAIANSFTVWR